MSLVLKGLVKLEISFRENDNFRNDLLLSYLSNKDVQNNPDVFNEFYVESLEDYIFGLTQKDGVGLEELKNGRDILSYRRSVKVSDVETDLSVKI